MSKNNPPHAPANGVRQTPLTPSDIRLSRLAPRGDGLDGAVLLELRCFLPDGSEGWSPWLLTPEAVEALRAPTINEAPHD